MTNSPDYRLYMEEKFEGLSKLMSANFINVHEKLESIDVQTKKTNGRVNELEANVNTLEKDLLTHPIKCDQAKIIKSNAKKTISVQTIATIIAIAMFVLGYLNLRAQNKKMEQGIYNLGTPVITNPRGGVIQNSDSLEVHYWSLTDTIQ